MTNINELSDSQIIEIIRKIIYSLPIFFEFEREKIMDGVMGKPRAELMKLCKDAVEMKRNFENNKEEIMKNIQTASKNLQLAYMDYNNALAKYNISKKELADKDNEMDLDSTLNSIF